MNQLQLVEQINTFIVNILRDKSQISLDNFKEFIKFYYVDVIKLIDINNGICDMGILLDVIISVLNDDYGFLSSSDMVETERLIASLHYKGTNQKFVDEVCDIIHRRKINALFNYGIPIDKCRSLILFSLLEDRSAGIREVNNTIIRYHHNNPLLDHRFVMAVYGILYDTMEPILLTFMVLDELSFGESLRGYDIYFNSFAIATANIMSTCKVPELVAVLFAYNNNVITNKVLSLNKKFPYEILPQGHPALEAMRTLEQRGVRF